MIMDLPTIVTMIISIMALAIGVMFFQTWRRDREREFEFKKEQAHSEERRRIQEEGERDEQQKRDAEKEEEREARRTAGVGTGGYIILDLPEAQRPFFHDLLKGFEDFAKLKGYSVSFSIDSTYKDRIAFKFNLSDDAFQVGPERVRRDFKEYLDRIRSGDPIENLPVVISIEEHELLVTVLKNRINFLQHSYNLTKNTADYYEALVRKVGTMPMLSSQHIVLQTGGALDTRSYSATNSPRMIQGDLGTYQDDSVRTTIRIGNSFNERRAQIDSLNRLLELLTSASQPQTETAIQMLSRVKEELEDEEQPDPSRLARWMEKAKQALQLGSLGREAVDAAKQLFELFNIS